MRALHLLKTADGATWALRQIRELVDQGVEIHVLIPDGPLVAEYRAVGASVHIGQASLPTGRPDRWPSLFREFAELVETVRPDLIHSHFVGTTLTMRLALGRKSLIPRLFQVPGPLHLEHGLFRTAEIATAGPSDFWVGSCNWTCQRYLKSGVPANRVYRSIYGVDIKQFEGTQSGILRSELGCFADTKLVGMVAYMYRPKRYLGQRRGIKGHEDLIDALAICRSEDPTIEGVFIGGSWGDAHDYAAEVMNYGRNRLGKSGHFLGTRNDVPRLYPDFDVAVHPSHSENLGGAGESLLMGIPTIATQVGGFPDLISTGETGWLVPPKSPSHLADAIREVLGNRMASNRIAANGQTQARNILDVRNTSQEIRTLYERIAMEGQASNTLIPNPIATPTKFGGI